MNREVLWCLVILIIMCTIGGVVTTVWLESLDYRNLLFYPFTPGDPGAVLEGFIRFWTFFIIFQVRPAPAGMQACLLFLCWLKSHE